MAKIEDIKLVSAGSDHSIEGLPVKLTVCTTLRFHPLELESGMEYYLHLFIVLACADPSSFAVNLNWDEAQLFTNKSNEREMLKQLQVAVKSAEIKTEFKTICTTVSLEKQPRCGVKVLGKLIPVWSQASKMSHNYIFDLQLK